MPDELLEALKRAFGATEVEDQFDIGKESADGFDRKSTYTPRPDYAIKPFNKTGNPSENVLAIGNAFKKFERLIGKVTAAAYPSRYVDFSHNPNPRVFIAVEDEINSPTRKHRLGSIVNASLLGKVGIVSGGELTYGSLCRIKSYFDYVGERKGLFLALNVIVIKKEKLVSILNDN